MQLHKIAKAIPFLSSKSRPRLRRFVLACVALLKGESNEWPPKVVFISSCVRFERNRGSRSVSDNAWPGSEEAGRNGRQVLGRRRSESRGNGAELSSDKIQWH